MYKKEIEEKVERKIIEEPEKVERLSRNSKNTLSPEILEQIETITPTFRDLKGNLLDEGSTRLYKSNIKAIAKRYTPSQSNLNFLVTEPEKVIEFLNTFKDIHKKPFTMQ